MGANRQLEHLFKYYYFNQEACLVALIFHYPCVGHSDRTGHGRRGYVKTTITQYEDKRFYPNSTNCKKKDVRKVRRLQRGNLKKKTYCSTNYN